MRGPGFCGIPGESPKRTSGSCRTEPCQPKAFPLTLLAKQGVAQPLHPIPPQSASRNAFPGLGVPAHPYPTQRGPPRLSGEAPLCLPPNPPGTRPPPPPTPGSAQNKSLGPWLGTLCSDPKPLPAICITNEAGSGCWALASLPGAALGDLRTQATIQLLHILLPPPAA